LAARNHSKRHRRVRGVNSLVVQHPPCSAISRLLSAKLGPLLRLNLVSVRRAAPPPLFGDPRPVIEVSLGVVATLPRSEKVRCGAWGFRDVDPGDDRAGKRQPIRGPSSMRGLDAAASDQVLPHRAGTQPQLSRRRLRRLPSFERTHRSAGRSPTTAAGRRTGPRVPTGKPGIGRLVRSDASSRGTRSFVGS